MPRLLRVVRIWPGVFIVGLVLSGIAAFPLESETALLVRLAQAHLPPGQLLLWLERVHQALSTTNAQYPFLAYGTDWLAFAHLVIAIDFVGPWLHPVHNKWVIQFGVVACIAVIPWHGSPVPFAASRSTGGSSIAASESSAPFHFSSFSHTSTR